MSLLEILILAGAAGVFAVVLLVFIAVLASKALHRKPAPPSSVVSSLASVATLGPAEVDPLAAIGTASDGHMRESIYRAIGEHKAGKWAEDMAAALGKVGGGSAPKAP